MVIPIKKPKVTTPEEIEVIEEAILEAVEQDRYQEAAAHLEELRPPDQADILEEMNATDQDTLLDLFHPQAKADILEELENEDAAEIASRQELTDLTAIVEHMEPDEAADLLGDMEPGQAFQVLEAIAQSEEVRPLMAYDDESAGGIMTSLPVTLLETMTVAQATDVVREAVNPEEEEIFYLFVVDQGFKLTGIVSIRYLLLSRATVLIRDIMKRDVISILATADQEEAARLMARYDLLALPVVNENNILLGIITLDDSIEVLVDEATEDIYRLGGVPKSAPADVSTIRAVKSRLPWLALNMITAMSSAAVLSFYEDIIAQIAVLTAFMPIVAGVSGSSATQSMTVTVRGLALGEIELKSGLESILKEIAIGLIDGIALGLLVSVIAILWKGDPMLGIVVGISIFLNLICAALAGVFVPMVMVRFKFDPALASPILVTTATDTLGYLIYFSIASAVILPMMI
ncbi:MAG: magnesium transporter [Anaerolineae bacterium]|jgi:magnesium transporter|nr:magnesium transporter [Anaerolineae bacterium]